MAYYSTGGGVPSGTRFYAQGGDLNPWARNVLGLPQAGTGTGATTGTTGVAGQSPSGYNSALGGIPAVADPLEAITKAIQGSISSLPAIKNLTDQITQYNQQAGLNQANLAGKSAIENALANLPAYQNYASQIQQYNQDAATKAANAAALAAINSALENLGPSQSLASQINQFNQGQAVKQITDLYPQFNANTAQLGANIGDWAAGNISQSTRNALAQSMAERGVAGGFGANNPATNAALMRLIGQTSEGLQQQALTGQNTLLSGLPKTSLFDVSSLMLSPNAILGQMGSTSIPLADMTVSPNAYMTAMGNPSLLTNYMVSPDSIYNAQQLANVYAAAPNPTDAYNLAMQNLMSGLNRGGAAGTGPFAGGAGTTSTGTSDMNKVLLDLLMQGGMPSMLDNGRPAGNAFTVNPYAPEAYTPTNNTSSLFGNPNVTANDVLNTGSTNDMLDYLLNTPLTNNSSNYLSPEEAAISGSENDFLNYLTGYPFGYEG